MLVCNISLKARRAAIAADLEEAALALDASTQGQIVFATLVDDPASVSDTVDAYSGEIMLEAASAADAADSGLSYSAAIDEAAAADSAQDATAGAPAVNNKAIDGTAGGQFSTTNTGTVTLTTTQSNDVIILMFYHENKPGSTSPTISTVTSSHLTWAKRKGYTFNTGSGTNCQDLEIWWATASAALTSEVITITLTGSIDDAAYHAFGVSGCPNPSAPWDTNVSLAGANVAAPTAVGTTTLTVSGVSTTSTVSMVIGAWGNTFNHDITIPSGTTQVRSPQHNGGGTFFAYMGSFYQNYSSAVSSASYTGTVGSADVWGMVIDALT